MRRHTKSNASSSSSSSKQKKKKKQSRKLQSGSSGGRSSSQHGSPRLQQVHHQDPVLARPSTHTQRIVHYNSHSHAYPAQAQPASYPSFDPRQHHQQHNMAAYVPAAAIYPPPVDAQPVVVAGRWADGGRVDETIVVHTNIQWYDDLAEAIGAMFEALRYPHPPNVVQTVNAMAGDSTRVANKMMEYWSRFTHVPLCSGGVDMSQKTILHCLCMRAEAAGPVQYLLEAKADPNVADNLGYTPLHMAARHLQPHNCELLLRHRAMVDQQDGVDLNTALHWCMLTTPRSRSVEQVLRAHGASDAIKNCRGETAARLKRRPRTSVDEGASRVNYGRSEAELNPLKCVIL